MSSHPGTNSQRAQGNPRPEYGQGFSRHEIGQATSGSRATPSPWRSSSAIRRRPSSSRSASSYRRRSCARSPGSGTVNVEVTSKIVSHSVQRGVKLVPGREEHRRRGFGKGRGGQVDHRSQPGARPGGRGRERRHAGRGHLRSVAADDARHHGPAGVAGRQDARADDRSRHPGDLDRFPDRHRHAHGVARADGDPGARAAPQGHPLAGCRLPHRRHAARAPETSS